MPQLFSIGHSTRSLDEFVGLLREHGIEMLVDVRRFPTSQRHPHFVKDALCASLAEAGIDYAHEPDMGGRRSAKKDSPNTAWRTKGFQGYADHMDTPEFRAALERVLERSRSKPTAIMCAEAVPWRCHRQLISDALVARGIQVTHIIAPDRVESHALNKHARVLKEGRLVYPAPPNSPPGQWDLGLGA